MSLFDCLRYILILYRFIVRILNNFIIRDRNRPLSIYLCVPINLYYWRQGINLFLDNFLSLTSSTSNKNFSLFSVGTKVKRKN